MADQLSEEGRIAMAKLADKDGDGVVEDHEIAKWKKSFLSVFKDITGAWSSKRVMAFIAIFTALFSTIMGYDFEIIALWASVTTVMVGVSLGEKK